MDMDAISRGQTFTIARHTVDCRRWTRMIVSLVMFIVFAALTPAQARANPSVSFHGGTMRNLAIDVIFWGAFNDADRRAVIDYVTLFSGYMNGTLGGLPSGREPAVHYYGPTSIIPGVWAVDPWPTPAESVRGAGAAPSELSVTGQIHLAQTGGAPVGGNFWQFGTFDGSPAPAVLPRTKNRLTIVMTKGQNSFSVSAGIPPIVGHPQRFGGFHFQENGLPYGAVMLDPGGLGQRDFMTLLAHEIIESMTDPLPFGGWLTNEGFGGLTHEEVSDKCGGDTSLPWFSAGGDNITGISQLTINKAYSGFQNITAQTCQTFIPIQSASMAAVVNPSSSSIDLFYLTPKLSDTFDPQGGHVMEVQSSFAGASLSGPIDWGMPFVGALFQAPVWAVGKPAVVRGLSLGELRVFVRGSDNALWMLTVPSGIWESLGAPTNKPQGIFGDPSAVNWNSGNNIIVYAVGSNNVIHFYGFNQAGGFGRWSAIQNNETQAFVGAPKAISKSPNTLDLFAVRENGHLGQIKTSSTTTASTTTAVVDLGSPTAGDTTHHSPIALTSWGANRLDILITAQDSVLHRAWNGSSWASQTVVSGLGVTPSGVPALISFAPGRLDGFVIDRQNRLKHAFMDSSGWHSDASFPAISDALGDPVVLTRGSGQLEIFYRSTSGSLKALFFNGTGWTSPSVPAISIR